MSSDLDQLFWYWLKKTYAQPHCPRIIVEDDDLKVGSIILQEHQVHEWDHNSAGMKPIKKNTKEYQKVIPETRRAH